MKTTIEPFLIYSSKDGPRWKYDGGTGPTIKSSEAFSDGGGALRNFKTVRAALQGVVLRTTIRDVYLIESDGRRYRLLYWVNPRGRWYWSVHAANGRIILASAIGWDDREALDDNFEETRRLIIGSVDVVRGKGTVRRTVFIEDIGQSATGPDVH